MRFPVFTDRPLWPAGLSILRLIAGLLIMPHGVSIFDAEKIADMAKWLGNDLHLPAPLLLAYLAKGTEFFGGLLLVLGLGTRLASLFLVVTMAVAVFGAHGEDVLGEGETALLYLLLFINFLWLGPGPWSLDRWLVRRPSPE